MTLPELIDVCNKSVSEHGHIILTNDQINEIKFEQIDPLRNALDQTTLMQLPEHEIRFFEWLKESEPAVWNDLWGDTELPPYLVGLEYLKEFAGNVAQGAFHICDLQSELNYFFTPKMFYTKESKAYVEAIRSRFEERDSLTPAQAFALEADVGPVDIWHFSYRTGVSVDKMKKAVQSLVDDRILVHVPIAEHLIEYFDVN